MNYINPAKVRMRNLLGLVEVPTLEDLLFEIVFFLDQEKREDGIFTMKEASTKTSLRISGDIIEDIEKLFEMGYIEKQKGNKFKVIKHLW